MSFAFAYLFFCLSTVLTLETFEGYVIVLTFELKFVIILEHYRYQALY